MTHGQTNTYWCTLTRTGVRWVTAHSTHSHSHKYIHMQPAPLSACNHQQRGHSIEKTTEERINQGHHVEHAVTEWRTTNQKREKRGASLTIFMDQSERGRVSESRHAGRGGLAICVQVRFEPISTRLYVSHRVMGWKNSREGEGGDLKKKVVGKERGQGLFKPKRLPTAIILLLV